MKNLGDVVRLRKFTEEDIPDKVRWINDEDINQYLHYDLPLEIDKTMQWFESIKEREDRYDAVIECNEISVGLIGLLSINEGKAEYYITIGEKIFQGKGVATEASRQLLSYAKEQLCLNKIYLFTEVENQKAQNLFKRIGFEKKGIERDSAYNRGKLVDRYYYEIQI